MQQSWKLRQSAVENLERHLAQKYFHNMDLSDPFQYATTCFGQAIISYMKLYVMRPLQRHPNFEPPPPEQVNILLRATEALEQGLLLRTETTRPWHWYFNGFVSWHPLATLLTELCSSQSNRELVERAWRSAEIVFSIEASKIAEGSAGPIWRPLKKLMVMARQHKATELHVKHDDLLRAGLDPGSLPTPDQVNRHPGQDYNQYQSSSSRQYGEEWPSSRQHFELDGSLQEMSTSLFDNLDDSWANWQGFVDDVARGNSADWMPEPSAPTSIMGSLYHGD